MKNIAYGILLVILLSILVEPLVEVMEIGREKVMLGSALSNACRASALSVKYEQQRDLDAQLDEDDFMDNFSEVFATALGVTYESKSGNKLVFSVPSDSPFNELTVDVDIEEHEDLWTEQIVTRVKVHASTKYKFKTKYLKMVAGTGVDYELVSDRIQVLYVKN